MSDETLAHLTFMSHLRRGLAAAIDQPAGSSGPLRPAFPVQVELNEGALQVATQVELYGPGDVTGIDPAVIIRTDPQPRVSDFEPNFFPLIEFSASDLPWRFTPAKPDAADRLRPWIVLVVLAEGEYERLSGLQDPLPIITVAEPATTLPNLDQSWAWGHVQLADQVAQAGSLAADLKQRLHHTPEQLISRLMCPRRLLPDQAYRAFLVPAMEAGRLAGLGLEPGNDGLAPAWTSATGPNLALPVYYEWSFRTGERGDFEALVRRLETRDLDQRVGIRMMDVSQPGYNLPGLAQPAGLEGALKSLNTESTAPPDQDFEVKLTKLLNLPETLQGETGQTEERVIGPPIYGRWHAEEKTIKIDNPPWLQHLNLDPRHRSIAGLGTQVVRDQQEQLMAAAWQQIGAIREANQIVFQGQMGVLISLGLYQKHIEGLADDRLISLAQPVHARITGSATINKILGDSRIPRAAVNGAFRRTARARGPLAQRIGIQEPGRFVSLLNTGKIAGAGPAPERPDGTIALDDAAEKFLPTGIPTSLRRLLPHLPLILYFLAFLLLIGALLAFANALGILSVGFLAGAIAVGLIGFGLRGQARHWGGALGVTKRYLTPQAIATAPARPNFALTAPGEVRSSPSGADGEDQFLSGNNLGIVAPVFPPTPGDSQEAALLRESAVTLQNRFNLEVVGPAEKPPIDLDTIADKVRKGLDPRSTISNRIQAQFTDGRAVIVEDDDEPEIEAIMTAPEFPQPMYAPLRDLSQDYLLPGLEHVPNNTVGLLQTNPQFVESYLAGLNHEMARELLWREYPTDQRGSYFRQFWDVSGNIPPQGGDLEAWLDALKDIRPMHTWEGDLGQNRVGEIDPEKEQLVLLIRGDLLRKYPTAVFYAEKARWNAEDEIREPDSDLPKEPIFRGTLPPDVTFVGFDLTADEVKGFTDPELDQGWFFIIQQQHTELRFGLDAADGPVDEPATSWAELSWGHLAGDNDFDTLTFIDLDSALPKLNQIVILQDEPLVTWGEKASDMAHITLQQPFRAAIHGSLMLPEPSADGPSEEGDP